MTDRNMIPKPILSPHFSVSPLPSTLNCGGSRFLLQSRSACASLVQDTYRVVPCMKRPAKTRHQCRRCPLRGPAGRCLNPTLRSGRCGDWIWYVRGGKQHRRRYARPKDPCTLAQLLCRSRLRTAARRYSRSLTQAERAACIAAGAKVRSRSRLAQSGPLTGQQYWIREDCARASVNVKSLMATFASQLLQPQRVTRSTSDIHRIHTGDSPESHRLGAVRARKGRWGTGLNFDFSRALTATLSHFAGERERDRGPPPTVVTLVFGTGRADAAEPAGAEHDPGAVPSHQTPIRLFTWL